MSNPPQIIRIFISSPGDVTKERDGARGVIEGLQRRYPGARLQPVLWEELALPATASFQETIDFLLEREPIDIAVFILWSRLGSPLGPSITRPDGSTYRSGTEREFDLMLAAFEQSGRTRPVILAYARDDDKGFMRKLAESPKDKRAGLFEQQQLAEAFIIEQFHDAEGRNLRAYQTYREPILFIKRLRAHLRQAIDELVGADAAPTWTEEPYRGLEVFDVRHAPIFHGRDEETFDLLQRMRDQEQVGCAFVVIVGASGSGKSSLARAGVAAELVEHAGDDETAHWRALSFIPALAAEDLCAALVRSMADELPELNNEGTSLQAIAESLAENAAVTVRLSIAPAFARADRQAGGNVRLLLILDQLEELWTNRQTTSEDRQRFLAVIEALAKSGHVAVLATLRSDFYPHAQQMPIFLKLKGQRGHYDLLPPDPASLQRLITEPARVSGLRFERDEQAGRSLDEVILEDAARDPGALPLVQFTLAELYQQRDQSQHLLTFAAYDRLGGVEGALGKRASETFDSLPADAQAALNEILPLLVSVDIAGEQSAVRRRATLSALTSTPAQKTLTEHLTSARFLTTDRQDNTPIASLAHEALLRRWDRIVDWIAANRQQLLLRARVEQSQQRWEQQDRDDSLLLPGGLPLDEGRQLLGEASYLLTEATSDYIRSSIEHHEHQLEANLRQKQMAEATGLVQGLLRADTLQVPTILTDLSDYQGLARDQLTDAFNGAENDSNAKLHAALALFPEDDAAFSFLKRRLLAVSAAPFETVRNLLASRAGDLVPEYRKIANDPTQQPAQRFQAACALASYDADNEHDWQDQTLVDFTAEYLVNVTPSDLVPWQDALRPVKKRLTAPLAAIYRDDSRDTQVRGFATDTLGDYLSDDPEGLFDLLADANQKQFPSLFDKLVAHQQRAIELGNAEFARTLAEDADEDDKEALAMRQANAAVMLLRMQAPDHVWPLLKHSPDPRARSYIIDWASPRGVESRAIIGRYACELDVTVKRALLLCLGEFDEARIPEKDRDSLVKTLLDVYQTESDCGLHGAARWLLSKWGQASPIAAIDEELRQTEEQLLTRQDRSRQWYVNGQGQTLVILDAGELLMGSPQTEAGRAPNESLHGVRIGRRIAIATTAVTRAQWRDFDATAKVWPADQEQLDPYMRSDDSPMIAMTWYEAASYCNWLSEREGIPTEQWCYQPNSPGAHGPGMKAKNSFLELTGYRLPTEAEWEFACRAGASTSRYYGQSESLLPKYAWYQANGQEHTWPVGSLKPNDFGMFDMQGNVWDWCYDEYDSYRSTSDVAIPDAPGSDAVSDTGRRVLRGGSFNLQSSYVRSAYRNNLRPDFRDVTYGFRVARTYHLSP